MSNIIEELQKSQLRDIPSFRVGDTLKISLKIVEGTRERIQAFTGTLIARKGKGSTETITLRRISFGEGVERILPLHSPRIDKIEVIQRGHVRRAKLYYLRSLFGKKARIQESKRPQDLQEKAGGKKAKAEKPKVLEAKPKAEEKKEAPKASPKQAEAPKAEAKPADKTKDAE